MAAFSIKVLRNKNVLKLLHYALCNRSEYRQYYSHTDYKGSLLGGKDEQFWRVNSNFTTLP